MLDFSYFKIYSLQVENYKMYIKPDMKLHFKKTEYNLQLRNSRVLEISCRGERSDGDAAFTKWSTLQKRLN